MIREGYHSEQIRNRALESILETLSARQAAVYQVIEKWQPISNERIAEHLNVQMHTVTPRVLELREMGIVEFHSESKSQTSGRPVSLWRVNPGTQLNLF